MHSTKTTQKSDECTRSTQTTWAVSVANIFDTLLLPWLQQSQTCWSEIPTPPTAPSSSGSLSSSSSSLLTAAVPRDDLPSRITTTSGCTVAGKPGDMPAIISHDKTQTWWHASYPQSWQNTDLVTCQLSSVTTKHRPDDVTAIINHDKT